jgi:hypothetical protein
MFLAFLNVSTANFPRNARDLHALTARPVHLSLYISTFHPLFYSSTLDVICIEFNTRSSGDLMFFCFYESLTGC